MTPEASTVAIAGLELNHAIARPGRVVPLASFAIAVAWPVCPVRSETGTVTATEATLAGVFSASTTDVPYDEHAATLSTRPVTVSMKVRMECVLPDSVIRRLD
jgi:polyisoprenoid-binding protein YceI